MLHHPGHQPIARPISSLNNGLGDRPPMRAVSSLKDSLGGTELDE